MNAVLKPEKVEELRDIIAGRSVIWVPVMHRDAGRSANALPMVLAKELAHRIGGDVSGEIVKVFGAANTGVSVQSRFANEQFFDGPVVSGGLYVVVDDNHTSGDTLVSLIDHIHAGGGEVIAATALAHSQSQNYLKSRPQEITKLLDKAGLTEESFKREFDSPVQALTGSEAYRLANLDRGRGIEWLRSRILAKRSAQDLGGSGSSAQQAPGGSVEFSLSAHSLASVADAVIAKWEKRPEWREAMIDAMRTRMDKLRRDGDWRVSFGRPAQRVGDDRRMAGNRTEGSIDLDAPMRQALRADELEKAGIDALAPWVMQAYEQGGTLLRDNLVVSAMLARASS